MCVLSTLCPLKRQVRGDLTGLMLHARSLCQQSPPHAQSVTDYTGLVCYLSNTHTLVFAFIAYMVS